MKQIKKKVTALAVMVGCALSMGTFPVYAAEDPLVVEQSLSQLSAKEEQQEYRISYQSTEEAAKDGLEMELSYGAGFTPEQITVGDWKDYEGPVSVLGYSKQQEAPVFEEITEENKTVNLAKYSNLDQIVLRIQDHFPVSPEMDGTSLSGTVTAEKAGKDLKMKTVYRDQEGAGGFAEKEVSMLCNDFETGTPVLSIEPNDVEYLSGTIVRVNGISGQVKCGALKSYKVSLVFPDRMFVDGVTLPQFQDASIKLFVNGNQMDTRKERVYINSRVSSFELQVIPKGDKIEQTKDMLVEMRNTVNTDGEASMYASVKAVCGLNAEYTAKSEPVTIHFQETETGNEPNPEPPVDPGEDGNDPGGSDNPGGSTSNPGEKPGGGNKPGTVVPQPPVQEEDENTILDFSGLNLQSAKATTESHNLLNPGNASRQSMSIQAQMRDKVQTTEIYDFTGNTAEEVGEFDNSSSLEGKPFNGDNFAADKVSKAKEDVKETVKSNRSLQAAMILGAVVVLGLILILVISKKTVKKESKDAEKAKELKTETKDKKKSVSKTKDSEKKS